ncbi:hypothetical protein GLOTRDRAFT_46656, partial [Gloeophyllum trabeum ATCC 11539]
MPRYVTGQAIEGGKYRLFIVSPEQLGIYKGHLPRFARLLQSRAFCKMIKHVHIDEAHHIYTAGLPKHGEKAFRPAYG